MVEKKQCNTMVCLRPTPNVLVSCRDSNGKNNALAVSMCCNCSIDPPMVVVAIIPTRYSHHMIKETGCFVVNLVEKSYANVYHFLGSRSGRDLDKFAAINVRLQDGVKVNAPILADCPVSIECSVVDSIIAGSHELFIARVEYVHANESLVDQQGNIDFSMIDFLL